jgi:class 3 adenylate cyclase/tetratricopeptide (TPR) repeat protein
MTGARCPGCSGRLPDGARFCPTCGRAVAGGAGPADLEESIGDALRTELRHLTVVFCDLVGSTALSATTDVEDYSELIQSYQDRAVAIVRAAGGDVEGYSGDGILFRFGWPQAHPDDAAQALSAALDIVRAVSTLHGSQPLSVRVGVHSGPAVVGELGGTGRRANMAVGETLNVASRLQSLCEPGTVVASAATVAQVGGRFDVTELGPLPLRGVPQPVEAYLVRGRADPDSRRDARPEHRTGLVGRERELATLVQRWTDARGGHGGVVLLRGEPGMGKSRLALQFRELVAGDDHLWLESACSSYTTMSVLRPLVDLVEEVLGFRTDTDPARRLTRLRAGLAADGVDIPGADDLFAALLGIPTGSEPTMATELRLERTIDVGVAWLVALGRRHPLVLVIEDLHWADPTTVDALQRLIEELPGARILLLVTARPEFEPSWPDGGAATTLTLDPLVDADARTMVASLGGDRTLPGPVVERIVTAAGGIPLYVEEVGRAVLESGVLVGGEETWDLSAPLADLDIPATLQASLLARLDSLGEAKAVAQLAAVVGPGFSFDLLVTVSGMDAALLSRHLDRVVESGLILRDTGRPDGEFHFKHTLVQEAAYESLLRRNRRTIHERVARVLDADVASGVSTAAEAVARHYEAAGLVREAAVAYQLAGRLAAERSGHREAAAFLRQGIDLARRVADLTEGRELEVEMQLALGSSLATRSYADPELAAAYDRARELCELLGNDQRVGQSLGGLSVFYTNRGEVALGAELAERVLAIASQHDDDLLEVLGSVQLSLARSFQGQSDQSRSLATRALTLYRPERHRTLGRHLGTDQGVAAHVFAGWSDLVLGHLDRGLAHLVDAVDLADTLDQPFDRAYALTFLATGHSERGEATETLRIAGEARRLAEEQGFVFWAGVSGVWESAERVVTLGDHGALDEVIRAGTVAATTGNEGGSTTVLGRVVEAALAVGDADLAGHTIALALGISDRTGQPWWDAALHRLEAERWMVVEPDGDVASLADPAHPWARAEAAWLASLEVADRLGYPVHGARAAAGYAGLLDRVGRGDEGRRLVAEWYGRCPEGLDTPVLTAVRARLVPSA